MKTPSKKQKIVEGGVTFALSADLAEQLGDVPAGAQITMAQFQRVLYRLADIRSGKVQRPNTAQYADSIKKETK